MIEEFRAILKRITKLEIKTILSAWGKIPIHQLNFSGTKYSIVEQILEVALKLHLTLDDVFQLDLLYLTNHPDKKLWTAYELEKSTGLELNDSLFQASNFEKCLLKRLHISHSCNVNVRKHNYALWGRVFRSGSAQVVYFVYFPNSCHFLLNKSAPNSTLTEIAIRALKQVLGYKRCNAMDLESNSPRSLAQILLHNNRTTETAYNYDEGFYKPLDRREPDQLREFCDERVEIQHMAQLEKEKQIIDRQYGKALQPQLQSLSITTNTRFRGRSHLPNVPPSTLIKCRTKIVGSNVLEGLRKAALQNLCHTPLPSFLTNVASTGMQYIKVTDKPTDENTKP